MSYWCYWGGIYAPKVVHYENPSKNLNDDQVAPSVSYASKKMQIAQVLDIKLHVVFLSTKLSSFLGSNPSQPQHYTLSWERQYKFLISPLQATPLATLSKLPTFHGDGKMVRARWANPLVDYQFGWMGWKSWPTSPLWPVSPNLPACQARSRARQVGLLAY
ncbi:hypothetical protein JHK82_048260 [Glycine max]|nr:hypothetical protein JHK82_048260 [Glycine max]